MKLKWELNLKILLIILYILFAGVSLVDGISFENYNVFCDIDKDDNVNTTITLDIINNGTNNISEINYIIPHKITYLNVSDGEELNYEKIDGGSATNVLIKFKKPIEPGQKETIKINFKGDLIWDKGGKKLLSISVPAVNSNFKMVVTLPQGASIVSPAEGLLSITPKDYTIYTDGKRIYVKWDKELKYDDKFFTSTISYAILTPSTVQGNNTVITKTNMVYKLDLINYALYVVLILIIIGTLYGIYYEKNKNNKNIKELKKLITCKEKEKEQLIKEISDLKERFNKEKIDLNNNLNEIRNKLTTELNNNLNKITIKDNTIEQLNKEIKQLKEEIEKLNNENNKIYVEKEKLNNELNEFVKKLNKLTNKYNETNNIIEKLNKENNNLKLKIKELDNNSKKLLMEKENKISELINKHKEEINSINKELLKYRSEIRKKEEEINKLRKELNSYESTKGEILRNILTDDEKMIINLIKNKENITQKDIVDITGLNKPKVSRIISDLENRKIIKKVKVGRINKVIISDELSGWL